jgi:CRP-like cAMP-binding protein
MERYVGLVLVRIMHLAACNTFHSVEQRCIRRLLRVSDLAGGDVIPLTHESLAASLGVRRPTVSQVLGALSRAGLISEKRGRLVLRDRPALEAACCECYRAMRAE